ncbi:MAG: fatty acid desaturase [Alphaproteobacteria bacterium]|nr:fatty acid desaturase [Alphaproteobacteria bacterium]
MVLSKIEWPTLALLAACYAGWGLATTALAAVSLPLAVLAAGILVTLYASLCHEVVHGHPTPSRALNAALVFPALTLVIPYGRFRDTHLDHHRDAILTDPYDDPETQYLDPEVWARLPRWRRAVLGFNNTLAGRLAIGPVVGLAAFIKSDLRAHRTGDRRVLRGWLWHIPALGPVALWFGEIAAMPLWAYAGSVYIGLALLKLRTFLEHQAHTRARARSVIIEDRGPLALLFLNNNLHIVHHMHPREPWYRLPALYWGNRSHYLGVNDGYRYRSYGQIIARYLWRRKEPVAHPLYPAPHPAPRP